MAAPAISNDERRGIITKQQLAHDVDRTITFRLNRVKIVDAKLQMTDNDTISDGIECWFDNLTRVAVQGSLARFEVNNLKVGAPDGTVVLLETGRGLVVNTGFIEVPPRAAGEEARSPQYERYHISNTGFEASGAAAVVAAAEKFAAEVRNHLARLYVGPGSDDHGGDSEGGPSSQESEASSSQSEASRWPGGLVPGSESAVSIFSRHGPMGF